MGPVTVSVIIPTFNMAHFLRRSLGACLRQTLKEIEVIVVDDGSTDHSSLVLETYAQRDARIRPHRIRHIGNPSAVRNYGLSQARGIFVQFLDADDFMISCKLKRQVGALQAQLPQPAIAYCDYRIQRKSAAHGHRLFREGPPDAEYWPNDFAGMFSMYTVLHRFLYPLEVLQRYGAFDETLSHAEDLDLWCRQLIMGVRFVYDPVPLVVYCQGYGHSLRAPRAEVQSRLMVLDRISRLMEEQGILDQYAKDIYMCRQRELEKLSFLR